MSVIDRFEGLASAPPGSAEALRRAAARSEHWQATRKRGSRDSIIALDMFSGCGGSSQGIEAAGIDVWYAANHWEYAVRIHERNHPGAEHFIADLVDTDATDYFHPESLPRADILWASPSCTNHSKANAVRAYTRNLSLFESLDGDTDYDDQVTASERSRATAVSVLQYARKHLPKVIIVENVVEFAQWGDQVGTSRKGDGRTFQWWLAEFSKLGYDSEVLYLNSQFFPPCPQSRDRMYVCLWQKGLRRPDVAHKPAAYCTRCDATIEAEQRFKPRTSAWPCARWGKYGDQYIYACPSCGTRVYPVAWPALTAIDWSDLGQRIGDRERPLAGKTMERIQRGVDKFGQWPPFLMPAKAVHGTERPVDRPMVTQTTQQELMMVSAFQVVAAGNTFERPGSTCRTRGIDEPIPTQHTTAAHGMVTAPPSVVVPNRTNNVGRLTTEPMAAITTAESRHLLVSNPSLPFIVKNNCGADPKYRSASITEPLGTFSSTSVTQSLVTPPGFIDDYQGPATGLDEPLTTQVGSETHGLVTAPFLFTDRGTGTEKNPRAARLDPVSDPMSTVSAGGNHHFLLSPVFAKQNGGPADTAWHQVTERLNTLLSRDTTCLLVPPDGEMPPVNIDDCFYRMLAPLEIQLGMGLPLDFAMWGSARVRVKALGNAVTPPVAQWVMERMAAILR